MLTIQNANPSTIHHFEKRSILSCPKVARFQSLFVIVLKIFQVFLVEALAIASTVRSGHQSLMQSDSHRNTILDNEFRRVGIGVVSGPIGLIIVQVFS